ncbi:MAG: class I SAM-dependent methyltransferase [Chloroflexi bacterium]|nr:class I SAM-dependent methyltransferase [Chloroflexota bacterium]
MAIRSDTAGLEKSYLLDMLTEDASGVLEIGCGDGRLTRKYADTVAQVTGIDLPGALPGEDTDRLPDSVSIAAASGVRLPFPARRFDGAIFSLSF